MFKYNVGLKILLQEGLSELEFWRQSINSRKLFAKLIFRYNFRLSFAIKKKLQHGYFAANYMYGC